jgi:hypothetical protein
MYVFGQALLVVECPVLDPEPGRRCRDLDVRDGDAAATGLALEPMDTGEDAYGRP